MCGIAGFVGLSGRDEARRERVRAMCDALVHRGPDDEGFLIAPDVALGMRRLSIIDVDGGHQPIANEDGSIHTVFNGEIYNHGEIRQALETRGHRFATRADTEVLVHLFEDEGDGLVDALRGMFAFAIWDTRRRRLLLARDRLGIKPLYYWESSGGLAFASELKALERLDAFPTELDPEALADYLSLGYVPEPASIYRNVRKLPPGCVLTWDRERGAQVESYWTPFRPERPELDERGALDELNRLLADAVRYRLIADVPLGAFLSGGLDSSVVVAEMARQMDRPVQTFSIGFQEAAFNEAPHAAAVADALGTDHTELVVEPRADALVEGIVAAFDEPFADSSAIPTYLVSRLATSHVKVALSGDGGDELFGGYTRYADLARRSFHLPAPLRRMLGAFARRLPAGARGRNRLLELSRGVRGRYAGMVALPLSPAEGGVARGWLIRNGADLDRLLARWFERVPDRDLLSQASFVDLISYLPGDILTKVDRMSMAASLEARVPLLDHHLVEFATSLPPRLKFRNGEGKWLLREAARPRVPAEVLDKPKQGFGVPLSLWFRNELRHRVDALTSPSSELEPYVEPEAVRRVVAEHERGRRDHSPLLWRLVVLQLWLRGTAKPVDSDALGFVREGGRDRSRLAVQT